jgi:hypothetical protein
LAAEVAGRSGASRDAADRQFVLSIAVAPVFLVWKGFIDLLAFFGYRRDQWSRTRRHLQR